MEDEEDASISVCRSAKCDFYRLAGAKIVTNMMFCAGKCSYSMYLFKSCEKVGELYISS